MIPGVKVQWKWRTLLLTPYFPLCFVHIINIRSSCLRNPVSCVSKGKIQTQFNITVYIQIL